MQTFESLIFDEPIGAVEATVGLTVLEGAARVSISSWVTHTLPDGYKGRSPRDGAAAGLVVWVRWEGQAVLKKKSSTTVSQ